MDKKNNIKNCFIITPIGDEGSEIRMKADGIYYAVIVPVLSKKGYKPIAAHKISETGSITNQIIEHIVSDELVIANLTGSNANVMYELAVRHAVRKPVICIIEKGTDLPFDIVTDRAIFYKDNMLSVNNTIEELEKAINELDYTKKPDNPIYRAIKNESIMEQAQGIEGQEGNVLNIILNKLSLIDSSNIKNANSVSNSNRIDYEVPVEINLGETNFIAYIRIREKDSVQDILNRIYFIMNEEVGAYEYMKSWVLKEINTGAYMIMYEVTRLVPAHYIFTPNLKWSVVKWDSTSYNQTRSEFIDGFRIEDVS